MTNVVALFNDRQTDRQPAPRGRVVLVGAGPGDPELLTRKAYARLLAADVVFYDELVSDAIVEQLASHVRRVYVGKPHGRAAAITQGQIIESLAEAAAAGATVVRLKGGDPLIFGRGGEEA